MRPLRLTSPLMKGGDVRDFQRSLNDRLASYGRPHVVVDGAFGPHTLDEAVRVAWWLGLGKTHFAHEIPVWAQNRIIHPGLRNPAQLLRARSRRPKRSVAPSGSISAVIAWEKSKLGVHEVGQTNWGGWVTTFLKFWGIGPAPWCGAFQGYALKKIGGVPVTSRVVYCPNIVADAKAGVNGFSGWHAWSERQRGDLVLYDWTGTKRGIAEHVEMYIGLGQGREELGGNTSPDDGGDQSNGGEVCYKDRPEQFILGVARPRW